MTFLIGLTARLTRGVVCNMSCTTQNLSVENVICDHLVNTVRSCPPNEFDTNLLTLCKSLLFSPTQPCSALLACIQKSGHLSRSSCGRGCLSVRPPVLPSFLPSFPSEVSVMRATCLGFKEEGGRREGCLHAMGSSQPRIQSGLLHWGVMRSAKVSWCSMNSPTSSFASLRTD